VGTVDTVKRGLDRFLALASVVLFALLVLVVVWQVFSRQVLSSPSAWTEELARYTFVWLGFFAAALVFSERGHIAVDFLVRKTPPRVQTASGALSQVAIVAFALVILVWGGWRASQGAWNQNLAALPTQVGVMYLVMPITGLLITFYATYHLIGILAGREGPLGPVEDVTVDEAV
jgi:TRAP-type C4-dicarboxylate transport system permease small subunit